MRIAVSVTRPDDIMVAEKSGASMIEARIDLFGPINTKDLIAILETCSLPVILTLRSTGEGGNFSGTPLEWFDTISPYIDASTYVDIEMKYAAYAHEIRERGKLVIASSHLPHMPSSEELFELESDLRKYGNLPKIIVTPEGRRDIVCLLGFTESAEKPIITGVMGSEFRYGRILCSLFGSEIIYCRLDTPAAEGQYTVAEASGLLALLR